MIPIIIKPINIPGIAPAKKSFPIDVSEASAYSIMGILGGITIPIVEDAAVIAALTSLGYFFLIISGIKIVPIEAVSATEEPEIPPKIILAIILTCPRAP